jgi:hypothetical protein
LFDHNAKLFHIFLGVQRVRLIVNPIARWQVLFVYGVIMSSQQMPLLKCTATAKKPYSGNPVSQALSGLDSWGV